MVESCVVPCLLSRFFDVKTYMFNQNFQSHLVSLDYYFAGH